MNAKRKKCHSELAKNLLCNPVIIDSSQAQNDNLLFFAPFFALFLQNFRHIHQCGPLFVGFFDGIG